MAPVELGLRDPDGDAIAVSAGGLRIGRGVANDLVLGGAHVSRRHAVVARVQGRLAIHDEHSTNGTFVNNHRVRGLVELQAGDVIQIGGHLLRVEARPRPSPAPTPAVPRPRPLHRRGGVIVLAVVAMATAILLGLCLRSAASSTGSPLVLPTPVAVAGAERQRAPVTPAGSSGAASEPAWTDVFEQVAPAVAVVDNAASGLTGTGFFIDAQHAVTNAHVVQDAPTVRLGMLEQDGAAQPASQVARVVGRDPRMDIAVLAVAEPMSSFLALAPTGDVRVGDEIMVVGEPHGLAWTATFGRVSALRGGAELNLAPALTAVQFDASINPGNSGGPLVARDGRAIGIVTFSVRNTQGLSFAVSGDALWATVQAWVAHDAPAPKAVTQQAEGAERQV